MKMDESAISSSMLTTKFVQIVLVKTWKVAL